MKRRKPGTIVTMAEVRLKGMKTVDEFYKEFIDYGGMTFPLTSEVFKEQIKNA